MKKIALLFSFFACFIFHAEIKSQQLGLSASFEGYFPKYEEVNISGYNNFRPLGHINAFSPGIRIEGNYILPGYSIPVSGFNGLGITYFFPIIDSSYFRADQTNGSYMYVLGTAKTTSMQYSFRFAYEIPQEFNEFLLLHFGWGMGYMHSKTVNVLPEKSATFNYDKSDFAESTFTPVKQGRFAMEVLAGGVYEFEHFSVMAQYSVIFGIGEDLTRFSRYRHGLTLGIFYPLKSF